MLSNFLRKILSLLSFWSVNDLSYIKSKDEKILKIIEKKLNSIHFNKKLCETKKWFFSKLNYLTKTCRILKSKKYVLK